MGSGFLDKGYEPSGIEEKWYKYWLDNGFFKAEDKSDKNSFQILTELDEMMKKGDAEAIRMLNSGQVPDTVWERWEDEFHD